MTRADWTVRQDARQACSGVTILVAPSVGSVRFKRKAGRTARASHRDRLRRRQETGQGSNRRGFDISWSTSAPRSASGLSTRRASCSVGTVAPRGLRGWFPVEKSLVGRPRRISRTRRLEELPPPGRARLCRRGGQPGGPPPSRRHFRCSGRPVHPGLVKRRSHASFERSRVVTPDHIREDDASDAIERAFRRSTNEHGFLGGMLAAVEMVRNGSACLMKGGAVLVTLAAEARERGGAHAVCRLALAEG